MLQWDYQKVKQIALKNDARAIWLPKVHLKTLRLEPTSSGLRDFACIELIWSWFSRLTFSISAIPSIILIFKYHPCYNDDLLINIKIKLSSMRKWTLLIYKFYFLLMKMVMNNGLIPFYNTKCRTCAFLDPPLVLVVCAWRKWSHMSSWCPGPAVGPPSPSSDNAVSSTPGGSRGLQGKQSWTGSLLDLPASVMSNNILQKTKVVIIYPYSIKSISIC